MKKNFIIVGTLVVTIVGGILFYKYRPAVNTVSNIRLNSLESSSAEAKNNLVKEGLVPFSGVKLLDTHVYTSSDNSTTTVSTATYGVDLSVEEIHQRYLLSLKANQFQVMSDSYDKKSNAQVIIGRKNSLSTMIMIRQVTMRNSEVAVNLRNK